MNKVLIAAVIFFLTGFTIDHECLKPAGEMYRHEEQNYSPGSKIKAQHKYHISGKVTRSFAYCGGANPPQEVLKSLARPVPYPGKKFYLRKGKVNSIDAGIVASFITDSLGMFSFNVPPGTYAIIMEEQLEVLHVNAWKKPNLHIDEKCLREWWRKPYKILEVKNHDLVLPVFHFQQSCFIDTDIPCIEYTGPLPY